MKIKTAPTKAAASEDRRELAQGMRKELAKERAASDTRVGSDTWLYGDLIAVSDWADGVGVAPIWKLPWDMVGDAIALDDPKAILNGNRDRILLTIDRWFYRRGLPGALKGNRPCCNEQTSTKH